jgi:outer membrane protein insertion porin family
VRPSNIKVAGIMLALFTSASLSASAQSHGTSQDGPLGQPISRLAFGVGWDPDRNAVGRFRFETQRFFRDDVQMEVSAEASATDHSFAFGISSDRLLGANPALGFNLYSGGENAPDNYAFTKSEAGAELFLRFGNVAGGALDLYTAYRATEISGVAVTSSLILQNDAGRRTSNAVGYRYAVGFGDADSIAGRFTIGQEAAWISDDRRTHRAHIGLSLNSAPQRAAVFSMALSAGTIIADGGVSRVNERFFLGSDLIRGFSPGGIGPRDLTTGSEALGGNQYATARFDVQMPGILKAAPNFKPGLFGDIGSLWGLDNTAGGIAGVDAGLNVRASAGISVAWTVDAGDLRLSIAQPLQKENYDQTQLVQFSFNTSF